MHKLRYACPTHYMQLMRRQPNTRVKLSAPFFYGGHLFVNIPVARRSLGRISLGSRPSLLRRPEARVHVLFHVLG